MDRGRAREKWRWKEREREIEGERETNGKQPDPKTATEPYQNPYEPQTYIYRGSSREV